MTKIIRLTERDLTKLVRRVIKEQSQRVTIPVSKIPCVKQEVNNIIYKITDGTVLSKFQGLAGTKPVLSNGNYVAIDLTNVSIPEKKYGSAMIFSNGKNIGTFNYGPTLGEEIYSIIQKAYDAPPDYNEDTDNFKIGWVLCNGQLYIYDMIANKNVLSSSSSQENVQSNDFSCLVKAGAKLETIGGPMTKRKVYSYEMNGKKYQFSNSGKVRIFGGGIHKEGNWKCDSSSPKGVKVFNLKDTQMMPM